MEATELVSFDNLIEILNEYGERVAELYPYNLALLRKHATGDLIDNVSYDVHYGSGHYRVTLNLMDYWKWVEGGSKGLEGNQNALCKPHFPPVSALLKWIEVKPVIPKPYKGKIPTPQSLAYLIGRKILHKGIDPAPALEQTLDTLNAEYLPKMRQALVDDMRLYVDRAIINAFKAI